MRKQSFADYFQLVFFGLALFVSVVLFKQTLTTASFCQTGFVAAAIASLGFRLLARIANEPRSSRSELSKLTYLITAKSFTALTGVVLWGCLAFANTEPYQADENSLLSFAAMSSLGILAGGTIPFFKLERSVANTLAFMCKLVAALLLIVFGFSGKLLPPQTFVFMFMALWSASYMCQLNLPKGKPIEGKASVLAGLEKSVAWGLAVVLATTLLICLATGTGVDTISSALQLRKFALASGVVALISLIFVNRTWARHLNML